MRNEYLTARNSQVFGVPMGLGAREVCNRPGQADSVRRVGMNAQCLRTQPENFSRDAQDLALCLQSFRSRNHLLDRGQQRARLGAQHECAIVAVAAIQKGFPPNANARALRERRDATARLRKNLHARPMFGNDFDIAVRYVCVCLRRVIKRAVKFDVMKPHTLFARDALQRTHLLQ